MYTDKLILKNVYTQVTTISVNTYNILIAPKNSFVPLPVDFHTFALRQQALQILYPEISSVLELLINGIIQCMLFRLI